MVVNRLGKMRLVSDVSSVVTCEVYMYDFRCDSSTGSRGLLSTLSYQLGYKRLRLECIRIRSEKCTWGYSSQEQPIDLYDHAMMVSLTISAIQKSETTARNGVKVER